MKISPLAGHPPPAEMLLDVRKTQPKDRQAWTSAKLTLRSEGTFDLSFDYSPKK